jgi:uncharacterized circularly permuted ATP-grasp superfamily protein
MKSTISKPSFYSYISLTVFGTLFSIYSSAASVKSVDGCISVYANTRQVSPLSLDIQALTKHPNSIMIKSDNGIFELPSDHPFLNFSSGANAEVKSGNSGSNQLQKIVSKLRKGTADLAQFIRNRSPELQKKIDDVSTDILGRVFGMGFKDKKGKPFDVRVNGIPLVIQKEDFDALVKGMEPTFELMRKTLQVFMSNPDAPPSAYPFKNLTEQEIRYIINEMKNSPYFDPSVPNKGLADYLFGSVYGVDATFGKLNEHLSHIFEINAGTPSGFSNMTLLFEVLRISDPQLFEKVAIGLSKNEAFKKLADVMDGHGKKMIEDGLSVELGTGIYNGAHPDISMIAHFSGMPLVERSDLFIDRDGYVRMRRKLPVVDGYYQLGDKKVKHVGSKDYEGYLQIWAVYSRSEEGNAIQENTRAGKNGSLAHPGIGIKLPSVVEKNAKLNKRYPGLNLLPGTAYVYKVDTLGRVYNVERGPDGKPLVEPNYDQFGNDPVDSSNSNKSLVNSLHKKKIYLSNLGTRLIDHKGILSLVTKEAQALAIEKGLDSKKTIVGPPPELRGEANLKPFYKSPRKYVVKVPDESGGVGVYILPTSTDKQIKEVIKMVKANPDRYVIQETADFMSVLSVSEIDGKMQYVTRANDGRVFIFYDANGKAVSDPWAILVRVADYLKLSTNTSQGAQYGWIKVALESTEAFFSRNKSSLPSARLALITPSQSYHLKDYLISINMILTGRFYDADINQTNFLNGFWNSARSLMSVLGPDFSYMIRIIENLRDNPSSISDKDFVKMVSNLKERLLSGRLDPLVNAEIENHIRNGDVFVPRYSGRTVNQAAQ